MEHNSNTVTRKGQNNDDEDVDEDQNRIFASTLALRSTVLSIQSLDDETSLH